MGQDKDDVTGKKLTTKKLKTPQPIDPNHPWYHMQRTGMMPPSPAASPAPTRESTSSYGTRSRESRITSCESRPLHRASPLRHDRQVAPRVCKEELALGEILSLPLEVYMEPDSATIRRRNLEVTRRREVLAAQIGLSREEQALADDEADRLLREEAERKEAWDAASAIVAKLAAEKSAEMERMKEERRVLESEKQAEVVSAAVLRIMAFKKQRRA